MKKSLIILTLFFSYLCNVSAQKAKLEELFDKYQDTEGVTSIKIAKPMFGMLNKLDIKDSELEQIRPLLSKIQGLKILVIEEPAEGEGSKPAAFYKNLSKDILTSVNNLKYEELMTVNSKGSKMKFLTSDAQNGVMDNLLLNISSQGNTVLMMLDGKITMDDVNNLVNEAQNGSSTTTTTTTTSSSGNTSTVTTFNEGSSNSAGSEIRNVGKFTGIEASAGVKVNFTQSKNQKVTVDTDPGMLPYIITKVENGILKIFIDSKGRNRLSIRKILVSVEAPHLQKIRTSSGASFSTLNTVQETSFDVSASSGSTLNAELNASATVNLETTSGASMRINANTTNLIFNGNSGSSSVVTGKAEKANFVMSSAASCNAQNMVVKNVEVSATSASSVKVNATKYLYSQTSSGASVRYSGSPKEIKTDNSSGGSTKAIN